MLLAAGAMALVLVSGVVWFLVSPGRRSRDADSPASEAAAGKPPASSIEPAPARAHDGPAVETHPCEIQTPEPGFLVFVDGELARDETGRRLTTPCEIGLSAGSHVVTIAREKFRDVVETVTVPLEQPLEVQPSYAPFAEQEGILVSRLALAAPGEPVELVKVSDGGPAWDPQVTADGLTLWFAGQKTTGQSPGKGIFVARRAQRSADFGTPELAVRTSERPASPSLTADGLLVAYVLPNKGQVRSLIRPGPEATFKSGPVLRTSEQDDELWPAAQISADGKVLTYAVQNGDKVFGRTVRRKSLRKPFDGEAQKSRFPGRYPRFSSDGLRQYWIEGERLLRAVRSNLESAFGEPELLADLSEQVRLAPTESRQFCVSEDEQWMYYADDPGAAGKLWVVRIANGPRRGYAPIGKPLPVREGSPVASPLPEPETPTAPAEAADMADAAPDLPADPRSVLLPYAAFRSQFQELIAGGDLAGAKDLVTQGLADTQLMASSAPLDWDRADIERLLGFRQRLEGALAQLQPGDIIKAGTLQIEFQGFADGVVTGKAKGTGKPVSKPLADFAPLDLVTLVDRRVERSDQTAQAEIATFVSYAAKVSPQQVQLRLDRAGGAGKALAEQAVGRQLHLIEQEIARENLGVALEQIDRLVAGAAKSSHADRIRALREGLYTRLAWERVGPQKWETPAPGEFLAAGAKSPGAYLMSTKVYRDFELHLEWQSTTSEAQGGLYFRFPGTGELRKNAYKVQLMDDYAVRDQPDKFSTGSLFGIQGPKSNPVLPKGEWNTLVVRVQGDKLQANINGVEVLATTLKSRDVPDRGRICLDGEFPGIHYRQVVVWELLPAPQPGPRKP